MRLDNADAACERGSYEIVVLSETMNISADSQKHSCCWRGTAGYYHTHACTCAPPTLALVVPNSLSDPLVQLKCVSDSENSSFKSDFSNSRFMLFFFPLLLSGFQQCLISHLIQSRGVASGVITKVQYPPNDVCMCRLV